jgi:hypothetical protein
MGEKQQASRAVTREVIKSYTYVLIWMSVSTAVILFNKWLLAYSGFPYPIALTMWHMAFCSSIAFVLVRVLGVVKSHNMSAREYATRVMPIGECCCCCKFELRCHSLLRLRCIPRWLHGAEDRHTLWPEGSCGMREAARASRRRFKLTLRAPPTASPHPTGMLYAGSLWLSNSAYLYLSVSFIQMTKSLMPGLVYGCGCFVGTEKFRGNVALNMALIAFGVVVCAMGEVNLVAKGLIQQLTALGFEVRARVVGPLGCTAAAGTPGIPSSLRQTHRPPSIQPSTPPQTHSQPQAMRLTLVQVLMTGRGLAMNPVQSLYYVSPACLVSLLIPFRE